LEAAGAFQVAVNTHHLADQVHDFLRAEPWSFLLSVSHEPEILGTGGGLRQIGEILGREPFLAISGDILTDLDLAAVYRNHEEGAVATLVLHDCPPYNTVWVAGDRVVSIGETPPARKMEGPPLDFANVQVVNPKMLDYLPAGRPYDLVTAWREALAAGERIAFIKKAPFWENLGTPAAYLSGHRRLLQGAAPGLAPFFGHLADPFLGPGVVIGAGVQFGGGVCLGAEAVVGEGAFLKNTVVWERAVIAPGVELEDCIVASGVQVNDSARGRVLVA
jgi:mannose-1-phosphate guanylyltransferase